MCEYVICKRLFEGEKKVVYKWTQGHFKELGQARAHTNKWIKLQILVCFGLTFVNCEQIFTSNLHDFDVNKLIAWATRYCLFLLSNC